MDRSSWLRENAYGRILEVGCGQGDLFATHPSAMGYDDEDRTINYGLGFTRGALTKLPFKDKEFSCAVVGDSLERKENPNLILAEAGRVATTVLFAVSNEWAWDEKLVPFADKTKKHFDHDELCELLEKAGMKYRIELLNYDGWSFFVGYARRS